LIRPSAVVVVAASTGGLGPLRKIAAALPYDLPATVLVVTHAARTGPSRLPLILSTDGPLPAMHAVDRQALEAGRILVGPPDRHLMIERDKVRVRLEPAAIPLRPCADILFESAARAFGPRTVGVVLSGKGTDGAAGLATIRAVGGRTIVQAPADAQAPSMPGAALEATAPDACVAAPQIALAIERLVRALPARQRTVIVLRYYEDLDDARIAEIMDCSTGTVRTHAKRALTTLRGTAPATIPTGGL